MSDDSVASVVCDAFAQANIVELMLCFATPFSTLWTEAEDALNENEVKIHDIVSQTRTLLRLRRLNRHWQETIDHSETLWLHMIRVALRTNPPERLFAGATFQKLYRALLFYKIQTLRNEIVRARAPLLMRHGCIIAMPQRRDEHPNPERREIRLPSEVNIRIRNTTEELESFLRTIHFCILERNEKTQDFFVISILRYRMFLYLKQKFPNFWIIPTADIQFCWLSHIFRTETYWNDMNRLGIDPSHSLIESRGEAHQAIWIEAALGTQKLWEAEYGAEYFPRDFGFTIQAYVDGMRARQSVYQEGEYNPSLLGPFLPVIGSNMASANPLEEKIPSIHLTPEEIVADVEWYPALEAGLNEISRNEYDVLGLARNKSTLYSKHLIPSYERFLNLCFGSGVDLKKAAPPYVLDLIWHAHQADPIAYKHDCQTLFGCELWHHPWPNGLGVSAPVSTALKCAWKQLYGTSMENDWQLRLPPTSEQNWF